MRRTRISRGPPSQRISKDCVTSPHSPRAPAELSKKKSVKDALKRDRDEEQREERLNGEIAALEATHTSENVRAYKDQIAPLKKRANAAADSPDRQMARRVLSGLRARSAGMDAAYRNIVNDAWPGMRRP